MKTKKKRKVTESPEFFEEYTVIKAQELIAELMNKQDISKAELAKRLKQSKAHVTELLSEGRNLTLKTLGRICYHLDAEVDFTARPAIAKGPVMYEVKVHRPVKAAEMVTPLFQGRIQNLFFNNWGEITEVEAPDETSECLDSPAMVI